MLAAPRLSQTLLRNSVMAGDIGRLSCRKKSSGFSRNLDVIGHEWRIFPRLSAVT